VTKQIKDAEMRSVTRAIQGCKVVESTI